MPTLRQIEASRKNAATPDAAEPSSETGKGRGQGKGRRPTFTEQSLSLPQDAELVAARIAAYSERFVPRSDQEMRLVEEAALDSVRVERCQLEEQAMLLEQSVRAQTTWDADRRLEAEELALKLGKQPQIVSLQLQRTTQGCALMAERWESLLDLLDEGTGWDDDARSLALDLLGTHPALRDPGLTKVDPDIQAGETALEVHSAVATRELDRLRERQETWLDASDERQRMNAANGLSFPSPAVWLIRRYEAACTRRMHKALKALQERCGGRSRPCADSVPDLPDFQIKEPIKTPALAPAPVSPRAESVATFETAVPESNDADAPRPTPPATVAVIPTAPVAETPKPKGNRRHRQEMNAIARKRKKKNGR